MAELVRATERLAVCLQAGLPWAQSLVESGADRLGGTRAVARDAVPGQAAVLVAVRVVERLGAPGAGVLGRAAASLREGVAADGRRASAVAGPAASARIVGGLPLAGPLVAGMLGVDAAHVLLGTPWGRACAVLGVALLAVSWWWSARLVRLARGAGGGGVDEAVVCDLVAAALDAGVGTATALREVARALDEVPGADPGGTAADLRRCATGLDTGDFRLVAVDEDLEPLLDAVRFSVRTGAPAGPPLQLAAEEVRRAAEEQAATATARLAARLVLPLGLCALPGFLLLGIAPVVVELLGAGLR
ncbi:type II secretion system F family protein [Aquipuribacter hungaricus]|uniref:Type II secretion system F family protein n=3 Tax=Aquipuribacter hungaricus TaxID=545624 RepID=A0ABV7WKS7_9MICO